MPQTSTQDDWEAGILPVQSFILGVAMALVDDHQSVDVTAIFDQHGVMILLRVAPDDLGNVIGKQGRTARSIRTVLQAASAKFGGRLALDIQAGFQVSLSSKMATPPI